MDRTNQKSEVTRQSARPTRLVAGWATGMLLALGMSSQAHAAPPVSPGQTTLIPGATRGEIQQGVGPGVATPYHSPAAGGRHGDTTGHSDDSGPGYHYDGTTHGDTTIFC